MRRFDPKVLDEAKAAELEELLRKNPDDEAALEALVGHYTFKSPRRIGREHGTPVHQHLLELTRRHPANPHLGHYLGMFDFILVDFFVDNRRPEARREPKGMPIGPMGGAAYDEFRRILVEASERAPSSAPIQFNLSRLTRWFEPSFSRACLEKALELDPSDYEIQEELADRLEGQAADDARAEHCLAALRQVPPADSSGLAIRVAQHALKGGKLEIAKEHARIALAHQSTYEGGSVGGYGVWQLGHNVLGIVALERGELAEAIREAHIAFEVPGREQDKFSVPPRNLICALANHGAVKEAIELLEKCRCLHDHPDFAQMIEDFGGVPKPLPGLDDAAFATFGERSKRAVGVARLDAFWRDHERIGTEHILVGLLEEGSDATKTFLRERGIDAPSLDPVIAASVDEGPHKKNTTMFLGTRNWTWAHTPFTEHAKNVLKLAVEEARGLGHDRVESEHLLLALIREREGLAGEILEKRGITLDATRRHFEGWLRRKREADGDRAASPGLALWLHGAIEHAADRARPLHERFSERTRWLLGDARSHAWSFYSMEFVAAEHVLLALALDQGPAGAVLKERGITDRNVGDAISKAYPERKELRDYVPKLPFTESAKMLLDLADEEAEGLGQIAIVPEHVLLAVTRDAQGPAGMLLVKLGQDLASLRASLLERFEKTASA